MHVLFCLFGFSGFYHGINYKPILYLSINVIFFFLLNKYLLISPHLVLVECEFVKKKKKPAVKMWGEIADRMN